MLKTIYIHPRKNIDYAGFAEFCDEAERCGLHVEMLQMRRADYDAVHENQHEWQHESQYENQHEWQQESRCEDRMRAGENLSDALIISDTDEIVPDLLKKYDSETIPLVGLGDDYTGKAKYVILDFDVSMEYIRLIYDRLHGMPHAIAQTDRIFMREMETADLTQLYEVYETLKDCEYVEPLYEYDKELEFTENYIKSMYGFFQYGLWLVFERSTGKLIGRVGLENREIDGHTRQELGYLVRADYQGQGYAYEACCCALDYAKNELGIDELFACVQTKNIPSANLARKLGFQIYAENVDGYDVFHRHMHED